MAFVWVCDILAFVYSGAYLVHCARTRQRSAAVGAALLCAVSALSAILLAL
ncbi:MAG: hypothetical protein J5586_02910 [Clostridia bacterium]|jgi:hypothetical protein|nr:hypothetical protein [Clostridia bacterium]